MRNRILRSLDAGDLDLIRPALIQVDLPLRTELVAPNQTIEHVHFIEGGLASILARAGEDRIEVGVVGFEGMTGVPVVLGATATPFQSFMQIAGHGYRLPAEDLRRALADSPSLLASLLKAVHANMIQIAQTALANGRHTVEQRLARWILMAQDRLEDRELAMTHEFLALMLGVRRPGVTVALHILEGAHAIRARRGLIIVLNREILKTMAGTSYGETEAAFDRLAGAANDAGHDGLVPPETRKVSLGA